MVAFFIHALISVFAVLNPLGILPTFLALTAGHTQEEQRQVAKRTILNSFLILLAFLLLGNLILQWFSITISAFRVAGGILLFGIAYDLLHAKLSSIQDPSEDKSEQSADVQPQGTFDETATRILLETANGTANGTANARPKEDITLTPLAIPVVAGPGTITSVMALAAGPDIVSRGIVVFLAFSVVLAVTFLIFYYASYIHKRITQTQLNVVTRLMGFILSIIAIQMAATGLGQLFPGLMHL
ncbi:NAAT family transporter [Alicyclobacillus curvatus]|jgi:multiple antibiotic resistance protein|nr:NAAT family transporter [Alicyclobacillus curvatus]